MSVDILPGSDEWQRLITPSKVAAILGVSRWESAYRLWHRMKGITAPEPEKDIFKAGHAFESALAYLWLEDNPGWQLSPGEVQVVGDPELYGFPFAATLDRRARRGKSRRIVEMKIARSLEDWGDEFTDDAPLDYLTQVSAQMLFTGLTRLPAHLTVMGPYFKHHTYQIALDPRVATMIIERCQAFYTSLRYDEPPELDDSVATYECVREQHPDIDAGIEVLISGELVDEYHAAALGAKDADRRERAAKTRVLDRMGNAQYGVLSLGDGNKVRVARRQKTGKGAVALYPVYPKTTEAQEETGELIA